VFAQVFKIEEKPQPPLVYNLVFGESILNDAVAIVLYKSFEVFLHEPFSGGKSVGLVIGEVLAVSVSSIAIGFSTGVLTSLIFKHFPTMKASFIHQFFFVFIMSYSSFLVAEACHFSGILAVFICGMVQSAWTFKNLTPEAHERLPTIFHAMAVLTENLIFCYLGMALFSFHGKHVWEWPFILTILAVVVFIRAIPVFGLTAIANIGRDLKIDFRRQIVLWFAGLRGAIAFVLAVEMSNLDETPNGPMFMSATLVICLFTTFVEGTLTRPLLKALKLDSEEEPIREDGPALKRFENLITRYITPHLCNPEPVTDGTDKAIAKGIPQSDEDVEADEAKRTEMKATNDGGKPPAPSSPQEDL
jgi:NhaP-type Na+/H+ or K+/H+ antiporter